MLQTLHGVVLLASLVVLLSKPVTIGSQEFLHPPIVVKQARTFINVLNAGTTFVCNARVAFLQPWQLQGVKSKLLKDTIKELHEKALSLLAIQIFSFSLSLLGPKINHADSSSRQLSDKGCCFLKSPCDVWTLLYLSDGSGL